MTRGKVYLVGAGPGDADLITVKGLCCIQQSDVIIYDRLVNPALLQHAREQAKVIYCGKSPGFHALSQESIIRLLIQYSHEGNVVTRLKGGDPFVFGRGGEEANALVKEGIPFEIVPGVTAGIAAPAYAGIPLTHRGLSGSFTVVTGHRAATMQEVDWKPLAKGVDTLVIYMGVAHLPTICTQLIKHGRDANTPSACIQWGTTSRQTTLVGTLQTIVDIADEHQLRNPAIIVIGEVVKLRHSLQWFEQIEVPALNVRNIV